MRAVVFVGPTLPPAVRPADPIWEWHPPVRQGDVYRAALTRPNAIGIVDGYFETVPTVWHKEILWAMAEGVRVYGAASIGALRAAELDCFGMIGVGRIYEDFRDGVLQDDDEVAVLHGPAELGYPALTEALVNIRATLSAAAQDSIVSQQLATDLVNIAKRLFYKERAYVAVLTAAAASGWPAEELRILADWLPDHRVDLKRLDTNILLTTMCSHCEPCRATSRLGEGAHVSGTLP